MAKLKDFKLIEKEWAKRPGFRKAYEEQKEEFQIAAELIRARAKAQMTQAQLAKKIGTKRSAISRLESPGYNTSVAMLRKVAKATGRELQIKFV